MDAVSWGVSVGFGGGGSEAQLDRDRLFRAAYPVDRDGPRYALIGGKSPDAQ